MDRTNDFYDSGGQLGYGTQILMGDGASPEVFQAVGGVSAIVPGDASTPSHDVTHLRSQDAHSEVIPGIRTTNAFALRMIYNPADESQSEEGGGTGAFASGGLLYVWKNRLVKNWKILLEDGTYLAFPGYVSKWQLGEISNTAPIALMVEIQPTRTQSVIAA